MYMQDMRSILQITHTLIKLNISDLLNCQFIPLNILKSTDI